LPRKKVTESHRGQSPRIEEFILIKIWQINLP